MDMRDASYPVELDGVGPDRAAPASQSSQAGARAENGLHKFTLSQGEEASAYYRENGYVIFSNLIAPDLIAKAMTAYDRLKKKKLFVFRAQDTNRAEAIRTNEFGYIEHSILDPIELTFSGGFSDAIKDCVTSKDLAAALRLLSGKNEFGIWQTMFFDKSTGTVAHQDHWYLDSDPAGNMIAAWISLEDIHPDSGCFYIVPKSHRGELVTAAGPDEPHEEFVARTQRMLKANRYVERPCPLAKGDVLLWHPFLIHGAFENQNPAHSRKSITAHFIPDGCSWRGGIPALTRSANPSFRVRDVSPYARLWKWGKRYARVSLRHLGLFGKVKMEMKSSEYRKMGVT